MSGQNSVDTLNVGEWTKYHALTPDDQKVWDETPKPIGVVYTPETVSTQLVNGTNYRFRCSASVPGSNVVWEAIVEIFKPINGSPYITGIIKL